MADAETLSSYMSNNIIRGTPSPLPRPYLPALPPRKTVKPSYSRYLEEAPLTALQGVVADAREPPSPPKLQRSRNRLHVGNTNRWRLANSLGSDLLGSNQALKAATSSYNDTIIALMTADNPTTTCFHDDLQDGQGGSTCKVPTHSLISPRFLKSHPALGSVVWKHGNAQRMFKSQPFTFIGTQKHSSGQRNNEAEQGMPTPLQLRQIEYHKNFLPPSMRSPTPMEMFLHRSQIANAYKTPDVILYALDTTWELHKPYLQKSALLSAMIRRADQNGLKYISEEDEEELYDILTTIQDPKSLNLQALKTAAANETKLKGAHHERRDQLIPRSSSFLDHVLTLKLRIKDPLITKQSFACALAAMYETENEMRVEECDVVGILAAAHCLGFAALERVCATVMLNAIASWSVCAFHAAGTKYIQRAVSESCERWLEISLVPQLSVQIYLSHLPQDLLEKTLKSTRIFTWNEYSLYKLLCYWIFLQQHQRLQLMPSWGTVVTWFMSLPKTSSFLEREEGYGYVCLFRSIRMEGITDSSQLDEVQKMNVIPSPWLLRIYSQHYHALQGGGDMSLMTRFEQGAIRIGFIIEQVCGVLPLVIQSAGVRLTVMFLLQHIQHHTEIISLHGFYFEVKAVKNDNESSDYTFFIQRLKPNDPTLSFKACARHTFSMRQDREVWFHISVLSQIFGFSGKMKRSE
ncbi:hypothetical protein QZH41_013731, partial [Actinostola sp. cb2023]